MARVLEDTTARFLCALRSPDTTARLRLSRATLVDPGFRRWTVEFRPIVPLSIRFPCPPLPEDGRPGGICRPRATFRFYARQASAKGDRLILLCSNSAAIEPFRIALAVPMTDSLAVIRETSGKRVAGRKEEGLPGEERPPEPHRSRWSPRGPIPGPRCGLHSTYPDRADCFATRRRAEASRISADTEASPSDRGDCEILLRKSGRYSSCVSRLCSSP